MNPLAIAARARATLGACLVVVVGGACAGTPRVTDALADWRAGRHDAALAAARAEVERFRAGNHVARADIDLALAEVDHVFADETPIVLPDDGPPDVGADPRERPSLDQTMRRDLASDGTTRVLRALRSVERLALARFATDAFVIVWRRAPWSADGPLLGAAATPLRALVVKEAAVRALEALGGPRPRAPTPGRP